MSKNSETLHRVAATFQAERDPSQDAIINWLNTLAKNERGQLHRSVLKYHLTQALLQYIPRAATASSGSQAVAPAPKAQALAPHAKADGIPVLTDHVETAAPQAVATAPVEPVAPKIGGGLRAKLAASMGQPKTAA